MFLILILFLTIFSGQFFLLQFFVLFISVFVMNFSTILLTKVVISENLTVLLLLIFIWLYMIVVSIEKDSFVSILSKVSMILSLGLLLSDNLMLFYVLFEFNLVPLFVLMMKSGHNKNRLLSGVYIYIYTVLTSLPFLIIVVYFLQLGLSSFVNLYIYSFTLNYFISLVIFIPFLMKFPLFGLHLWLPKAHVESPTSGSMILAGVMMKLGVYAIWQFFFCVYESEAKAVTVGLSLLGGVYSSFMCLFQLDMKSVIAYSSVVHMSISYAAILESKMWGVYSSVVLLSSHAFGSCALFLVCSVVYDRLFSRSMVLVKGLSNLSLVLSFWLILLFFCNMAVPFSISMLGELLALGGVVSISLVAGGLFMFLSLLINLYNIVVMNSVISFTSIGVFKNFWPLSVKENLLLMFLVLPIVCGLFVPDFYVF
uniref:NADH dehydrogenase subunit 4 n=1 Tax=Sacculina confragosa TaxID=238040 RepID=UPI002551F8E3|nr:NADH dehydrogenase subunit 4 [Sacculina confragosa]WGU20856.1 NADH dehydrogenase subunit 4 [Sacculina confragosa]